MPELPEVEIVRKDLERDVVGRKIKDVTVKLPRIIRRHKNRKEFTDRLTGRKIAKIERRGKYILLGLDSEDVLVMHLGMSGHVERATGRKAPDKHTHVIIKFVTGGELRFVDMRQFGELFVSARDDLDGVKELQHIAIDPLEDSFTWQYFSGLLVGRQVKLKTLLMDQKFISGIGNIYSDEILWAAGLRHDRLSDSLTSQEVRRLYRSIQEVLQEGIRHRGVTLEDETYKDLYGETGSMQDHLKAYGREGEPCRRCRTPIVRERWSNRSTYFCPQCQV
ncbi:MAG TPA: bifunctional DNA-formamidopyrimidine glycosylase/DNA-(apurinic or apyrimidinic site) lyase [Actinomycetota bacterium]|nr:bifunctional DNA-formamidopyrimidine glycosylase/DNA-(apurinic or apyrimidinic site) lyase [Actinomycetota bacterium]